MSDEVAAGVTVAVDVVELVVVAGVTVTGFTDVVCVVFCGLTVYVVIGCILAELLLKILLFS